MPTTVRVVSLFAILVLGGCDPKLPPETTAGQPTVTVAKSSVIIPISIKASALSSALNQKFATDAVLHGRTPELSANLLAQESITVQEAEQVLVHAVIPCHDEVKKVPRTVSQHVKVGVETVKCLVKPWKWGSCSHDVFKDVTTTVWDDVKDCVGAEAAVFKTVMTPVVKLQDKVFPTSVWINYEGHLHDINLTAAGRTLRVGSGFKFQASADVKSGVLSATVTVKGALTCSVDFDVQATATLTIGADGVVDIDVSDFALDPKKFCIPGAIEAVDLATAINPDIQRARLLFGNAIKQEMLKLLNKELASQTEDDRDLKKQITKAAVAVKSLFAIGDYAWIDVRPEGAFLSQISGTGSGAENAISVTAGVIASPIVTFGEKPAASPSSGDLTFNLTSGPPGAHLRVHGLLQLDVAKTILENDLKRFMDDKFPNSTYSLEVSNIYQSGVRVILVLSIIERKTGQKVLTGALSALSFLTDDSGIALRDVTIDDATRQAMLKVADWFVASGVERFVESATRFNVAGNLTTVAKALNPFEVNAGVGTISGRCERISEDGIWIANKALNVLATADCQAALQLNKLTLR